MSEWIEIDGEADSLPDENVPVLLFDGQNAYFGQRELHDGGWYWCYCCLPPTWANGVWTSEDIEGDDIAPTHWMPLPDMPVASGASSGE
jgi:hypothetical protein